MQDIIIDVQTEGSGVSQRGFGRVLVLSHEIDQDLKPVSSIADLDVKVDSKTYEVVSALLSQDVAVEVMVVGKKTEVEDELLEVFNEVIDEDFYFITTSLNDEGFIKSLAKIVGTLEKFMFVTVEDPNFENDIELDNVAIFAHSKGERVGEGLIPIMADDTTIGGKTAKWKTVKGMTASGFGKGINKSLMDSNINYYKERLGLKYVAEGVSSNGEYIDVILGKHWVTFRLEEAMLQHFVSTDNVDYTNQGISELIDVIETTMKQSVRQGIFEEYSIEYLEKALVPKPELASRRYDYLKVEGTLKGAIHGANVKVYMVL